MRDVTSAGCHWLASANEVGNASNISLFQQADVGQKAAEVGRDEISVIRVIIECVIEDIHRKHLGLRSRRSERVMLAVYLDLASFGLFHCGDFLLTAVVFEKSEVRPVTNFDRTGKPVAPER